jgi:Protein of unknown function (DUF2752)
MQVAKPERRAQRLVMSRLAVSLPVMATVALLGWWLYSHSPADSTMFPACMLHSLTGLHCPGCGGTRCVHALLHLRFCEALRMNAPAALALPFFALIGVRAWWLWLRGLPDFSSYQPKAWHAWAVVTCLLAFSVLRNLPWEPFVWLAPGQ